MKYDELKLREGEYLPDVGIEYPEDDPFASLVQADSVRDLKFDETYPYLDDSFSFKFQRCIAYGIVVNILLRFANMFKFGLKFKGRDVLRRYRKEFSNGLISVCNHCYPWDGAAISLAFRHRLWLPMLAKHFNSSQAWYLKYFGGIPVPEDSMAGLKKFNEAFDELNRRKAWIHIFPEARNWHFYKPVRPFRKGAFTMAYKYGVPVLPVNISYRERKGIYRLFADASIPLLTVNIGEPVFPDTTKPRKTEVVRLLSETHKRVCELGGIIENPWPDYINEQ